MLLPKSLFIVSEALCILNYRQEKTEMDIKTKDNDEQYEKIELLIQLALGDTAAKAAVNWSEYKSRARREQQHSCS